MVKVEKPDNVIPNIGWRAKFQVGDGEVDLVDFPAWAFWFVMGPDGKLVPKVETIVPADDDDNFDFGSELEGYCGFEEPQDLDPGDILDGEILDDDDDDDDDDGNPIDQMGGSDNEGEVEDDDVIDTVGVEVGEPAGRAGG